MEGSPHIPIATYRLQFNRNFTFRDAAALVPYLSELGISHCYASPYLRARPASMHGYDIIDHNALNPEIGTREDYEHFVDQLHRHGMGQILDIVPNHMGVMGSDNAWWLDVLENGEASEYADFFDIDWNPIKDELQGKVLIPILGEQYGNELERGNLKLVFDVEHGEFSIFYQQNRFPVAPRDYPRILTFQLERLRDRLGADNVDFLELQSIATAFSHLPERRPLTPEEQAERKREKEVQKRRLAALCARSIEVREFLLSNLAVINGDPSDPRSFDTLHDLIKQQAYRLAKWRVAADDINYRRFFDINDLAALRTENDRVFAQTHRLISELVAEGKVNGLRVDHPDGLYDPTKYFRQLTQSLQVGSDSENQPIYIIAEKILTGEERLRADWPVAGTTGYEFANLVNGLFVDPTAAAKLDRIYRLFTGESTPLHDLAYACKKLILKVGLASELNVLANLLSRIALANRHTCDFTLNSLRSALSEIIACFPVYRTYVAPSSVSPEDRRYIQDAIGAAKKRSNAADLSVFDFILQVLLLEANGCQSESNKRKIARFAMKFQQVTAAVMAKGVEDTAFYRFNRLVSLNEVGGSPAKFGTSIEEFHLANQERRAYWPHSMLASSTHDSKRSEDVRARVNVISELPGEWRSVLRRWRQFNRSKKRLVDDKPAPSRNDEYLLYQTLVGVWPDERLDDSGWKDFTARIEQYMLKAVHEAKENTSWANTNFEYEAALTGFVRTILERKDKNPFLPDFTAFHRRVSHFAALNSLSQSLLKMTAPGVPDIYQGNELFDFSLVDPDNRRPVDYAKRANLLRELQREAGSSASLPDFAAELISNLQSDQPKLYTTWKTLSFRRENASLFQEGDYLPLRVTGAHANHVVAFARNHEGLNAVVVVPRLCASLLGERGGLPCKEDIWLDTKVELPQPLTSCYHNVFTGECIASTANVQTLSISGVLSRFPIALLFPCH